MHLNFSGVISERQYASVQRIVTYGADFPKLPPSEAVRLKGMTCAGFLTVLTGFIVFGFFVLQWIQIVPQ